MNKPSVVRGTASLGMMLGWGAMVVTATGCQLWMNPFEDPFSYAAPITTASSIGAFEEVNERPLTRRAFGEERVAMADGSVTHGPLYFEDGFGDMVHDDGHFAWTGEDFLSILTWRARFLLNMGLFPISAIDTPPWCVMSSDGHASRRVLWEDLDAAKSKVAKPCCKSAITDQGKPG